jgi:putative flippase GtrA
VTEPEPVAVRERADSGALRQEPTSARPRREAAYDLAGTALRFGLVGVLKTALDFATFNLVLLLTSTEGGLIVLVANTAGFCVSVASSFVLNRRFTFRTAARSRGFSRYVAISLVGLLIYDGALALVLVAGDPRGTLALNVAKVVPLGASMVWNFVGYRYFVFAPRPRG